jgi:geranylgeranyl pyrophosphate synthase
LNLVSAYGDLQAFIGGILSAFPGNGADLIHVYFEARARHEAAIKQDLLPLLVYVAISGQNYDKAIPLTASWALYLAASHMVDKVQDERSFERLNDGVMALGAANVALSRLDSDLDTLSDLLDALGRITALGASAQRDEFERGHIWSRKEYLRNVIGKAAAIISTGSWIGGRLATDEEKPLTILKEFGLALGMSIQLSDDYLDLEEDLAHGTLTLPVIVGLASSDHPRHPELQRLISQKPLPEPHRQLIVEILENMGTIKACRRMARAYQIQAAAVFEIFPNLAAYFSDYVAAET